MADFLLFEIVEYTLALCHDRRIFTDHPNLGAFYDRFRALPTLSAYLNSEKYSLRLKIMTEATSGLTELARNKDQELRDIFEE